MLRFRTLGRVELVAGDPPAARLVPTQPKRLAVLAYLAIATPRGLQRRDALLAMFWPDLDADEGRRALRQALHALRRWLGDSALVASPDDRIGLVDGGLWCDVLAFEQALDAGRPADALALYDGDFFQAMFVADAAPEFDQWVDGVRRALRERAATAAGALASGALTGDDLAGAARWADLACRVAPEDETALRQFMRVLDRAGDRAPALRAYERFAQLMADDLDAEPAAETTALAERLRIGPATEAVSPAANVHPDSTTPPPPTIAVGEPSGDARDDVVAAPRGPGQPRWRTRATLIALALLVVAVTAGVFAPWRRAVLGPSDRLIVADFRNETRDSLIGDAVTVALSVDLAQSPRMRVLTRPQVEAVLTRMERPTGARVTEAVAREVAERDGIKAFVDGDIATFGAAYTVSARLVSVETGDIIAAVRETAADSTALLHAVDAVSRRLRRLVGESMWSVRATLPLEQVTTGSLEALRKYSQAIRVGDVQGDDRRAIGILREAVALDPHFAMAYRKLGTYYGAYNETALEHEAMQRAFRDRDRLPPRERYHTMGSYYLTVRQPNEAIAVYRALLDRYPGDMRALANIGAAYMWLKNFREAARYYDLALAADSSVSLLYNHLATAQVNAGALDAAAATLTFRDGRFPPQEDAQHIRIALAVARGDWPLARRGMDTAFVRAGPDVDRQAAALAMMASLDLRRGQLTDAERSVHAMLDIFAAQGSASAYVNWSIYLGFIDIWYRHARERGLRTIDDALVRYPFDQMSPLDRPYQFLAYAYALAGRSTQSRAVLQELRTVDFLAGFGGTRGVEVDGGYYRGLGAVELAEGRFQLARATLRHADDLYNCPVCATPDLGRAYELTGAGDSAIVTYERYVSEPWSEWESTDGEFHGTAYARLAALYEQRADTARAIAAYRHLADLWNTADSALQPDVVHARQRTAVLSATTPR
jgi:DNA-binding SARP family transcriptional activator/Tfp pilus assembly protein PilF